jgi:hypothetical protein
MTSWRDRIGRLGVWAPVLGVDAADVIDGAPAALHLV